MDQPQNLVRPKDAAQMLAVSISTLYRLARNGSLPRPIQITERSSAWLESELIEYRQARIAASRG